MSANSKGNVNTGTLFDKYGGFRTFQRITREFYVKVLDSEQLKHHFAGARMESVIDHQARFLSRLLGGPTDKYANVDLVAVHANLVIQEEEYAEITELLAEALEDASIEEEDIETIISTVRSLKQQIVSA